MLKRIFGIDFTRCPRCGAEVKNLAIITEPQAIRQHFEHFGIHGPDPPLKFSAFTNTGRDLTNEQRDIYAWGKLCPLFLKS